MKYDTKLALQQQAAAKMQAACPVPPRLPQAGRMLHRLCLALCPGERLKFNHQY